VNGRSATLYLAWGQTESEMPKASEFDLRIAGFVGLICAILVSRPASRGAEGVLSLRVTDNREPTTDNYF
jgi:hypothetical protein